MGSRMVHAYPLVLLCVVLAVALPIVADGVKATFTGGGPGTWPGDVAALMSMRLEDSLAPEFTLDLDLHRRILAGGIRPGALNPDHPACPGQCGARGRPYTNRGCEKLYRCNNGS